jgi:hypothetical protein
MGTKHKEQTVSVGKMPQKRFQISADPKIPLPDLIEPQRESFRGL